MPPTAAAARFNQSPLKKARSPKSEPTFHPLIFFIPVSRYCFTFSRPSFIARPIWAFCSGERFFELNALPSFASLARMPISSGRGGANCKQKSRYSKKFIFAKSLLIAGNWIVGAGEGAGFPRYDDSGRTL